jgi:hypothetical protein
LRTVAIVFSTSSVRVHLLEPIRDPAGDLAAVLPDQHEDGPQYHLLAVHGRRTRSQVVAVADLGDVAHEDGRTAVLGHDDQTEILQARNLAWRADEVLGSVALDVARAEVGVVLLDRVEQIRQCHTVGQHPLGDRSHQVLALVAADGAHLGHPRHTEELGGHDPVEDGVQIGGVPGGSVGLASIRIGPRDEHEDLAESGRDGPHRGLDAGGQLALHLLQSRGHEVPCEVDVGAILEDDRHLR